METTIHNVNKIKFDPIEENSDSELGKYFNREISLKSSDGEELKITCFGRTKENLEIEVNKTEKV